MTSLPSKGVHYNPSMRVPNSGLRSCFYGVMFKKDECAFDDDDIEYLDALLGG